MTWTTRPRSKGPGDLAFWREGQGPTVILIHGVGLRAEAWAGVMPLLSKVFTVLAIDMPGHGQSPRKGEIDLPSFAARFSEVVASLEGPVYVAGHSMGAMIALELAHCHPDRIAGVAALNGIYRRTAEAAAAVQDRAASLALAGLLSPEPTLQRWFGKGPQGSDLAACVACRQWLQQADPDGYAAAYTVFAHHDGPSDDLLKTLPMPALFQTGPGDLNSTPEMSRSMAALASQATCEIVPGAAHMMPMTHARTVAEAIRNTFLPDLSR